MNTINHRKILEIGKYNKISLKDINKKLAVALYTFMLKLRLCEEAIEKEYHPADEMRCPVHFCTGEEAVPASLNSILECPGEITSIQGEGIAATCLEGDWVGSLSELAPGDGYWFRTNSSMELSYDCPEQSLDARSESISYEPSLYAQSTQQGFYFFKQIDGIEEGDIINCEKTK